MKTKEEFLQFYEGNQIYESLIKDNLNNPDEIPQSRKNEILSQLIKAFNLGLPYHKRPFFLYYFYKIFSASNFDENNDLSKNNIDFFLSTIHDKEFINYLYFLDKEELFEVVQIRGNLYADGIDLPIFAENKESNISWDQATEMADSYLKNEPCVSIQFLEKYFRALYIFYYNEENKLSTKRIFDLSDQILKYSQDQDSITSAWIVKNDEPVIREYYKETLSNEDLATLNNLESLENQIIEDFGDFPLGQYTRKVVRAIRMLSKERREEREEQKEVQKSAIHEVKMTGRSSVDYIKGYVHFICARIYLGTDDLKKGLDSLEKAYNLGFYTEDTLLLLYSIHSSFKNRDKAAEYAQELMKVTFYESYEEARKDELGLELMNTIKESGMEPIFSDALIQKIIEENKLNIKDIYNQLDGNTKVVNKKIEKERIERGIKLIDSFIDNSLIDEHVSNKGTLEGLVYEVDKQELISLSLEELDLFFNDKSDYLFNFYTDNSIDAFSLLTYTDLIRDEKKLDVNNELDTFINKFPCLSSNSQNTISYIDSLLEKDNLDGAIKLMTHVIDSRNKKYDIGLVKSIKKLVNMLNEQNRFQDSIALLRNGKRILGTEESAAADMLLKDTYFSYISNEKSPVKKNNILKEVEYDNLNQGDKRFDELRTQINNELNKRKKAILISSGIAIAIIAIVVLIYVY